MALRKSSTSEDDQNAGDATDTEQHDSLPDDPVMTKSPRKPRPSWGGFEFKDIANKALQLKRNSDVCSKDTENVADIKQVHIKSVRKKSSELSEASTSKRQDSDSSVWSDNIPVITISKTESAENILKEEISNRVKEKKFQPKIRCVLRKQSTEIDEDTIRYFNNEIEKNMSECRAVKEITEEDVERYFRVQNDSSPSPDLLEDVEKNKIDENLTDKSSSDDTEQKNGSVETILNFISNIEDEN